MAEVAVAEKAEEIQAEGWLIHADCLDGLGDVDSGSVDLVCMDPPFFSQRDYGEFDDRWESRKAYLEFMWLVLCKCARVMKPDASIYVHCDTTASHRIRLLMDEVFGAEGFRNEIVWCYKKRSTGTRHRFQRDHDVLLLYACGDATLNKLHGDFTDDQKAILKRGYNLGTTRGRKDANIYDRSKVSAVQITKWKSEGRRIAYIDSPKGKEITDVWDLPMLGGGAKERTGYPTQKPVRLLERIISASSNPGDLVLDPMCGSGTALVAAKQLGRWFIGIDRNENAVRLARERLDAVLV